jgi:hypothetical protein
MPVSPITNIPAPGAHDIRPVRGFLKPPINLARTMADKKKSPPAGFKYKPQFGLIITCASEREQKRTFGKLKRLGYTPKVVTV